MKLRTLFVVAFALLFAQVGRGQISYGTITGTITDINGNPYAFAQIKATFVNNQGFPIASGVTPNGQPFAANVVLGTADGTGHFSLALVRNDTITKPSGTQWAITVDSPADTNVLTYEPAWRIRTVISVTGNADISAALNALAQPVHYVNLVTGQSTIAGSGGLPVTNPAFTGTMTGPAANFSGTVAAAGFSGPLTGTASGNLPITGGLFGQNGKLEGRCYADAWQTSPGSNNGIQQALASCTDIIAPTTYATVESQPFGGVFGDPPTTGPKSTDPTAQFLDSRYGVPQWIFNGSRNSDNRHGATPTLEMNWLGSSGLNGLYAHTPYALNLQTNFWDGGRNFYNDKTNLQTLNLVENHYAEAQGGGSLSMAVNCMGNGDCLLAGRTSTSYGGPSGPSDEGNEDYDDKNIQGAYVPTGTAATVTVAADGSTTITQSSQVNSSVLGAGRIEIDITKGHNTGIVTGIGMAGGNLQVTHSSASNLDSTYGTSTQTTLSTEIAGNNGSTSTLPLSNVNAVVASSAGFTAGDIACITDYDQECAKVTAVPDGTHITFAILRRPHPVGAWVVRGGLTGFCEEFPADELSPTNTNGVQVAYGPFSTLRNCIPIIESLPGNITLLEGGQNTIPGQGDAPATRAYSRMAGSGGTCTPTVTGGALTGITVSGGTGYISAGAPPQIVFSGSWTTAPVAYITGVDGSGAVTSAAILTGGAGLSGVTCSIVAENPYNIYPAGKVYSVYNQTAGAVDGTLYTEPWPVTPVAGDSLEQPMWHVQHIMGALHYVGQWFATNTTEAHTAFDYELPGLYQGSDQGLMWKASSDPSLYQGYPGTPNIIGRGQLLPAEFEYLDGPWRTWIHVHTPPLGTSDVTTQGGNGGGDGYNHGYFIGDCGKIACSSWAYFQWMSAQHVVDQYQMAGLRIRPSDGHTDLGSPTQASLSAGLASQCSFIVTPTTTSTSGCSPGVVQSNAWLFSGQENNYSANSSALTAATWVAQGTSGGLSLAITTGQADPWGGTTGAKLVYSGCTSNCVNYYADTIPGGGTNLSASTTYTVCAVLKGDVGGESIAFSAGVGTASLYGVPSLTTTPALYCGASTITSAPSPASTFQFLASKNQTIYVYGVCTTTASSCMPPSVPTTATQTTALGNVTWVGGTLAATGAITSGGNHVPVVIASGTVALPTTTLAAGACDAAATTATATGVVTTDVIAADFNGDPTAITGYGAGGLAVYKYPTANTVNFKRCNNTSGSITPSAATLNWQVVR